MFNLGGVAATINNLPTVYNHDAVGFENRSNPDVGYIAEEVFQTFAFTQNIKVGKTLYLSGVTPLTGDLENIEVVGTGDMRAEGAHPLEIIKRCLAAEGATFKNRVMQPVYTTNMVGLQKTDNVFRGAFGGYPPTSMCSG